MANDSKLAPPPRVHPPAMVAECLRYLGIAERRGGCWCDGTLGTGGHTRHILETDPDCRVIALDLDLDAIEFVRKRLAAYADRLTLVHANFRDVALILENLGISQIDGMLIDAGVSLWQLDSPERGFSFRFDAPLAMTFNRRQPLTAEDLVNSLAESALATLLREHSDERWAERIAHSIVVARRRQRIRTTAQLAAIVAAAIPARHRSRGLDPATRTFAALRQSTNDEHGSLAAAVPNAATVLAPNAALVVLTYTSADDRLVKTQLKRHAEAKPRRQRYPQSQQGTPALPTSSSRVVTIVPPDSSAAPTTPGHDSRRNEPRLRILTPKPVLPSDDEVRANPRCRGARLRAAVRV